MAKKKITEKPANNKGPVIGILVAVLLVGIVGFVFFRFMNPPKPQLEFQKGMAYCTWSAEGYATADSFESLNMLKKTGTNWVAVLVTWYQQDCLSQEIKPLGISPSDDSIVKAIRKAHEMGYKVMLKPHVDIIDKSDGSWRGDIGCVGDEDWVKWFQSYTDYIMHYVDIAQKEKVEIFCVGTELTNAATTKGYMWRDLIKKIRTKYSGLLTYASHWDTYMDVRFWDMLDYVGINAYFPLSEKMDPTYEEMSAGWDKWMTEMEEFQKQVQKPIIFPEIGCNSCDGAAMRPWEHDPRKELNLRLQADYYKVLMDRFFNKEWFYGAYWWYWATNPNSGGEYNRSFTPQGKPAEKVVTEYYFKPITRKPQF
ncbi:MAG TPA: hypothetical protein PKY78_06015 [Candidatus Omnitrophota bacterium]|nr:hypothetical protein [Candidatus Omnitrophota bacterium]